LSGLDNSPTLIKKCFDSWKKYNPSWEIIFLDETNLEKYINWSTYFSKDKLEVIKKKNLPAHYSDIIRMILLSKYGGLWVDATTFCITPLDSWLPEYIHEGFFAYGSDKKTIFMMNWFIYSEPNNYIIEQWSKKTIEYYENKIIASPYLIHIDLFKKIYEKDIIFKNIWNKVPYLYCHEKNCLILNEKNIHCTIGPEYISLIGFNGLPDKNFKTILEKKLATFFKLSHKKSIDYNKKDSIILTLFSSIE
jgi:hypothetical protein